MSIRLSQTAHAQEFLEEASGNRSESGNPRTKTLIYRILRDTVNIIEDLEVTPEEFWAAVNYLNELGKHQEAGLLAAGLGLEHYLDLLMDAADEETGKTGGTPRTIEGPLYVAGAPLSKYEARLDDGQDPGVPLFMRGQVRDTQGKPVAGAIVDVWQANTGGTYSWFDTAQSEFNLRRRIETDAQGNFRFRSIVPSGYGCPPTGPTQQLLDQLGRHGQRPAHIHFFISAPGHRHLTTQINLSDDPYLHDDFAYATRDGLVPPITRIEDPAQLAALQLEQPFASIDFDFHLSRDSTALPPAEVERPRAAA